MDKIYKIRFYRLLIIFFTAILITFLIIVLTDKYRMNLVSVGFSGQTITQVFHDLNHDGISEKIGYQQFQELKAAVTIYLNDKIISHNIFDGLLGFPIPNLIGDIDNDNIEEIFVFTINNDTLYLHCIDYYNAKTEFKNIAICNLLKVSGQYQYEIQPAGLSDVNSDGLKEVFFSVITGFATRPRAMYAYYPDENILLTSPESCALIRDPIIHDIEGDGIPEIICSGSAYGNCDEGREYSDQYGWLMVFTPDLRFKFPPVRLDTFPAVTKVIPFKTIDADYILVLHWYRGTRNYESFIALYDSHGIPVKKRKLLPEENYDYSYLFSFNDDYREINLIQPSGKILKINESLLFVEEADIGEIYASSPPDILDLDNDGFKEMVVRRIGEREITIIRNNLSDPVTISFNYKLQNLDFSTQINKDIGKRLVIDTHQELNFYRYDISLVSKYWYFVFTSILIFCWTLYNIINKIIEFRRIKLINTRNQLAELQLKSVQNQIDPHFTFNLLESFGSLLNEHDTARAEYIFNKYSGLLKASVLNSDKIMVPLCEELDFIKSYLDLERFRYKGKFNYEINIDRQVDKDLQIPKMMVHIFVENAVKHGLKHLDKQGGEVIVDVSKSSGDCVIAVTDNGIGRKKAAEIGSFSTGRGLKIIDKMLELNVTLHKKRIKYKIDDLYIENKPAGTKVTIIIPG